MQTALVVVSVEGVASKRRTAIVWCILLPWIVDKIPTTNGCYYSFSRWSLLYCRTFVISDPIIIVKQKCTVLAKNFLPKVQMVRPVRVHVPWAQY